jgi:hypothetical protein
MKKSELRKYISEALTPDEASKVEPKYKETYAAMIRGKGPLKLKKYDNPDKVVRGRVINNLKESTRRTNEKLDIAIKEVFSEKQRKYMCVMAQPGAKRPKGLSKADAKEMCADTKISKKMNEGDLDVGHQDDEPRMIKKDIYNMGKYAMELYKKLDQYDDMEGEVDFPHWWQSKITKAKSMLQSAYDYLDGEERISQIDAIMQEEVTDKEENKLKKIKKELNKASKMHKGQADRIGKIVKEEEVKIGPHTFKKIKDDHYHKIDKNGNEKTGRKFRQQEIDYLMKTLKETGQEIAKKNMDDYKRLNELVKAALMKETSTDKYDDNPALKGKQSELPDGLQKAIIKKSGGKVDEVELPKNIRTLVNQEVKDAPSMARAMINFYNQIKEKESLDFGQNPMMKIALSKLQDLASKGVKKTNESFDSLVKKVDKAKGYTKKEAEKVAGSIAAKKRAGAGKGPTAKQKKRMAETILKELRK